MSRRLSLPLAASFFLVLLLIFPSFSYAAPKYSFDPALAPASADYSLPESWAALPESPRLYPVDVFFVHPTTYIDGDDWNQSIEGEAADPKIQSILTIQAGVFSSSACLYAPYYRQANLAVLRTPEDSPDRRSLEIVAYSDVEAAFDAYMSRWNEGRPFILAGHSQGAQHLLYLMERRFGDSELREKLVAAYIIGWSVTEDDLVRYPHLKMAETPDQTGCIVSYNTQGPNPKYSIVREGAVAVNPLTMTVTGESADADLNQGAVFFTETGIVEIPCYTGGQTVNGAFIIPTPSNIGDLDAVSIPELYHSYDYAFFYRNLQQNADLRIRSYLESRGGEAD